MAEIISLRQRRKEAERAARRRKGDENAARFGISKAERAAREKAAERAERLLDGARRDD